MLSAAGGSVSARKHQQNRRSIWTRRSGVAGRRAAGRAQSAPLQLRTPLRRCIYQQQQ